MQARINLINHRLMGRFLKMIYHLNIKIVRASEANEKKVCADLLSIRFIQRCSIVLYL